MVSTVPVASSNGHSSEKTLALFQEQNARSYILALKSGRKLALPDVGKYYTACTNLAKAFDESPDEIERTIAAFIASKKFPGLRELLVEKKPGQEALPEDSTPLYPALPASAHLPEHLAHQASPVMDRYIEYSKQVSPEGYEFFHEGCFLWLLSTIAARRIRIPLGDDGYTPLMIVMVAESSMVKKTTTAKVAMKVMYEASLDWFLGSKRTTPQKMVFDMAGVVPKNYNELDAPHQERVLKRLAFSGQRAWYNDEFGKFVRGTMNQNSIMADFQQLLLEMDSCDPIYDNSTIARGTEIIEKPYLALLGSMTPANIKVNAKRGSEFWGDGFWARFVFICSPRGLVMDNPFQVGDLPVPGDILTPLYHWHERLGIPQAFIDPVIEKEKDTGRLQQRRDPLPENVCTLGEGVYEAWVRYRSALKSIIRDWQSFDLNASYDRLPTKAIRVAALLASLENNGIIEMCHWAKAQEIAERWRASLHELYAQVNSALEPEVAATLEEDILRHVEHLAEKDIYPSAADLRNYMKRYSVARIQDACDALCKGGLLGFEKTSHTKKYKLVKE